MPPLPGNLDADFGTLPMWYAIILATSFFGVLLHAYIRERRRSKPTNIQTAMYFFSVVVMLLLFLSIDLTIKNFYARLFHFVAKALGLHSTQFIAAMLVTAAGFGAHRFKQTSKLFYGYIEVAFGVLSAVLVVTQINFAAADFRSLSLAQYGTLVGCAYVVARGLNNISEAKEEKTVVVPEAASPSPTVILSAVKLQRQ